MTRSARSIQVLLLPTEDDGISSPVLGDARGLDERDVELAEEALPHHLRDMREVDVEVVHQAGVDLAARGRVGLVGHAQVDPVDAGKRAVELGRRGRARPDTDVKCSPWEVASDMRPTRAPGTAFGWPAPVKPLMPHPVSRARSAWPPLQPLITLDAAPRCRMRDTSVMPGLHLPTNASDGLLRALGRHVGHAPLPRSGDNDLWPLARRRPTDPRSSAGLQPALHDRRLPLDDARPPDP